jgi:hypothetical protein
MLVPTVLVRLSRPTSRESLDGFVIGALAALMFAAGSTLTRLAPQFATGLLAHSRPVKSLLVEAGICGVTIPLTAAVAGGMVGIALWFKGQDTNLHEHPARTRRALWVLAVAVVVTHTGVAITDIVGMPQLQTLVIHVVMSAVDTFASPDLDSEAILSPCAARLAVEDGFSGVAVIAPFACLPGRVIEALFAPWARARGVPVICLENDGNQYAANVMSRLEVFATQASRRNGRR